MSKVKTFLGRHKKLWVAAAVVLVLALVYHFMVAAPAKQAAAAAAANVSTFPLERGQIDTTLSVSGTVISGQAAHVTTGLAYPVAEVKVQEGDTVAAGDVLVVLDTADLDRQISAAQQAYQVQAQQAELAVQQAARRVEDARNQKKIDEERAEDEDMSDGARDALLRTDSLAIEDAQDALRNAAVAQQGVTGTELKQLQAQRAQCSITAPQGGVITSLDATVGGVASKVATIEDPNSLQVELRVREYDINKIAVGQTVTLTSGADERYNGKVEWIAPKATQTEGTNSETVYLVRVAVNDPASTLRLGMSAKAKILLDSRENVFAVPLDAVGTDAQGNAVVYAKQPDGSFSPIVVTTGLENDVMVEIEGEGLTEGMELQSLAPETPLAGAAMQEG